MLNGRGGLALVFSLIILGVNLFSSRSSIRNLGLTGGASFIGGGVDHTKTTVSKVIETETKRNATKLLRAVQSANIIGAVEQRNGSSVGAEVKAETIRNETQEMSAQPNRNEDEPSPPAQELPQPHTGARDINGNLGYVADETRVRRWILGRYQGTEDVPPLQWTPTPYSTNTTDPCGRLLHSDEATRAILKIIPDHPGVHPHETYDETFEPKYTKRTEEYERYDKRPEPTKSRLLCAIYTYNGKHEQITAVEETWGWKCDGFFAASTETVDDPNALGYGAINLTHAGPEHYGNMWQKTRSILAYMHDHYASYDYFWVGGDDTYMVVENIKRWLSIVEDRYDVAKEPLYLGHYVKKPRFRFAGGGPGYILNRKALEVYFEKADNCQANAETSAEDRFLGMCFDSIGIKVEDTADARGQQRFIGYAPGIMAQTTVRNKFFHALFQSWIDEHPQTTMGPGLYSEQAFGLHWFKTPEELHHLHALLYRTCPLDSVVGAFIEANDSTDITIVE